MKRLFNFYTLIVAFAFFLAPQTVSAAVNVSVSDNGEGSSSHVSVNSQTNGQSTTCVNGNCTTTGGDSQSTVCINGKCTTSEGNVDVQSEDGRSQVHISNNTNTTITPNNPSITPDPTIMQMRNEINNKVKEQTDAVKEHVQKQENAIEKFFREQIESLDKLFKSIFG